MDTVACLSVNDAFVMSRWIKSLDAADKVTMLADGGGVFAEESGLCVKTGKFGGTRLQRLAMIVSWGGGGVGWGAFGGCSGVSAWR